jgi:hypothetical protein
VNSHVPCDSFRIQQESAASKSHAFTASLQRTKAMLHSEIAQSSSALQTLTSSTRVLGSTNTELHTYGATVGVGRKIITKQLQRERTDKMLILLGLCFFALVVIYIVNRRLSPFLFWWTSFFVNKHVPSASGSTPGTDRPSQVYHTQPVMPPSYATPTVPSPDVRAAAAAAAASQAHTNWQPPSTIPAGVHVPLQYQQQQQQQQQQVPPPHDPSSAHVHQQHVHSMPLSGAGGIPQFGHQLGGAHAAAHGAGYPQHPPQQHPSHQPVPAATQHNLHAYDEPGLYGGHHHHDHAHEHGHAHGHAHVHA